jgi:predicted Zn-dependent protease
MLQRAIGALLVGALLLSPAGTRASEAQSLPERILSGGLIAAQGLFITTEAEVSLGARTAAQVLAKTPEVQDAGLRNYVAAIGHKVASHAERQDVQYTFYVIDDPAVNAFSLAGGYIFITTACLRAMQNEAQLAGVLGHEVGHVVHKDQVREIRRQMVASGLATAVLGGSPGQIEVAAAQMGATLVLRGYGRSAEYAADLAGATYASAAGYEPRELERFLGVLARSTGDSPSWLQPLADHPRSDDRIRRLDSFIAQQHLPAGDANPQGYAQAALAPLARLGGGGAGK